MRSRLPWIGLGSRVWSRMTGFFFTLLKDCLHFMKKIPDISLTIFCKGFSSIISMGSQETELFSLIPEAALTSEQVSFLSTGIFFQNLCFLFSHLRGVPRIRFQRHPHLALPWPTETEFSLHKHDYPNHHSKHCSTDALQSMFIRDANPPCPLLHYCFHYLVSL